MRKWIIAIILLLTLPGIASSQYFFDLGYIKTQNIKQGFLKFIPHYTPFTIRQKPPENDFQINWNQLNQVENGSITECTPPDKDSLSWKFMTEHKQDETALIIVGPGERQYPCKYVWQHLAQPGIAMASKEDIPPAIIQKFQSPYVIFFENTFFYRDYFHTFPEGLDFLRHEEAHLQQSMRNPDLAQYMWQGDQRTNFGKFIEGCTEFHFHTRAKIYEPYVAQYASWLSQIEEPEKAFLDKACEGHYDYFKALEAQLGPFNPS